MIPMAEIQQVCDEIVRQFQPDKVILFGSYAYGEPSEDSDVDLMVIMPFERTQAQQAITIACQIGHPFPMDLLVRKPEEVEWRYKGRDPIIRDAIDRGKVLYERSGTHRPRVA